MKKTTLMLLMSGAVLLTACKSNNPILSTNPDQFATMVNEFMKDDIGNMATNNCATYYIDHNAFNGRPFHQEMVKSLEKTCPNLMKKLQVVLSTEEGMKTVTVADLEKRETWEHYRSSKLARKQT